MELPQAAPSPLNPSSMPAGLGFEVVELTGSKQTMYCVKQPQVNPVIVIN
jgi:hypothetical protein